jgi:tape measure domain-containing protein
MAKLVFRVQADYEEVIKLRNEIEKLKKELKSMDATQSPAAFKALNAQLSASTQRMDELVGEAAKAGAVMEGSFKKKIFDASQVVNGLSEKIMFQRGTIQQLKNELSGLKDKYREVLKQDGDTSSLEAKIKSTSEKLKEQKSVLFNLTQEQANARLSVKKLRDEYELYNNDGKKVVATNNGIAISWKKALAVTGGAGVLKALGSEMIRVRGEFQAADTAIQTLLGSKEKADALMAQVREYAKISPLEFSDVTAATQMMLGFNIEAEKVPRFLSAIGDVSMGETQKFNSLTLAFSQMSAAGKLMGQDLNQMINAGFNPLQIMSEKTGKSIATLKDEMSKGAISAEMVQQAFIDATSAGGKFYNMSENASKTINGQLSMMQDAIDTVFNELGTKSEDVIVDGIQMTTSLIENYETVGKVLMGLVATYGTYRTSLMLSLIATNKLMTAELSLNRVRAMARIAQMSLNKAISANPYVFAATSLMGLVSSLYIFSDVTSAAEKAQNNFNASIEYQNNSLERLKRDIDQYVSVIRNETASQYEKIKAYEILKEIMPSVFSNMDIEKLKLMDILFLNEKISNEVANRERIGAKTSLVLRQKELAAVSSRLDNAVERQAQSPTAQNSAVIDKLQNEKKRLEKEVELAQKNVDKILELQNKTNKVDSESETKNKSYWEKQKKEAETALNSIASSQKKLMDAGNFKEIDADVVKSYKDNVKKLKEAEKELKVYDSSSKQQKEADKQLKQQEKLAEQLLSLRRKNQQDEIGLMDDGTEKKLAQIDADFDAQMQAIEKKAKELAKASKEAGITDVNKDGLTKDQQDEIDKARKLNLKARAKEEGNLYKAEAEAMRNYLKEYGTFQQQKLAIAEEYAEKIRKAQSEGERLSLEKERDSALLGVDVKAAQQNIDWQSVFGDLGLMLREQIQPTIDNLKKITQSDEFNNSSVEDQQRIYDILSQLERQSGMLGKDMFKDVAKDLELYRNSLNAYNKAQQREVEATNALVKAKENLKRAQENGGDVESARKAVDEAESIFNRASESVKALGDRAAENAEALKTSSEKARGALHNLADGLDKLKSGSLSQVFDGVKDIGKSLGGKIGDAIANIDPTGIIGGVLTILDVLKDGVSSIFVSLQDTLYGAIEGILDDVFSGDIIVKPIQNTLGHIGKILDTVTFGGFSSWFGIGGNAKEVQKTIDRLTERNEILGKSIDRLTDIMEKSAGSKAISAYEEARRNQQEKNENLLGIAQAQAGYHNSHKSWQHYMGWTDEQLKWAQENVDAGFTGTNSLWNLTPEQMNKLLSNVNIYEQIKNAGKGGYGGRVMEDLEEYAEQAGKIADLEASINESLMNVSFDSLRSSFLDSLMDMEKDAKEFSDDFSEMLQRALLDFSLGETFDNELKDWYNDVAKAISDNSGKLSETQMDDFKKRYDDIVNAAMYERDKIAELTGYTGGKDDTREASQKGIATASQDSVDENNGRLAVMQGHTYSINENVTRMAAGIDTIAAHTVNLSYLTNIDKTMQSILSMRDASLAHLSNIDSHTARLEAIENAIVFMKNDINTMLIKGLKLSKN